MDYEIRSEKLQLLSTGLGDNKYPSGIGKIFRRRIQTIEGAPDERTFRQLKALHFEKLQGARSHQWSMRLNKQYRLIIEIEKRPGGNKINIMNIGDYH